MVSFMDNKWKRKLLASANCQGHATEDLIDRLSDLPDKAANHILSFLGFKDLSCFGCVSKRCRELFLSTPSLNFNGFFSENLQNEDLRLRLWSYLDRYFFRRGFNRIERFQFHWVLDCAWDQKMLCEDESFRLDNLIYSAISCNVEVLDIDIDGRYLGVTPLPLSVLLSGTLKSLSLHMYDKIVKAPSLASFSNLECLKLEGVILVDEGIFKWISCSCKGIKELSLKSVSLYKGKSVSVTIESSSLESLCIEGLNSYHHLHITSEKLRKTSIDWRFGIRTQKPHTDKSLNICAPNLNSLNWTGNLMNQPNLGRLECLEEANVCLLASVDEFVYVSEVLSCLSSAKVLTLNKETTMALFKGSSMPLLKNVRCLCIHIEGFHDSLIPAMTSLLGGMSELNTLIIKSDSFFCGCEADYCGFNVGYWKLQNSSFVNQLKEVTIELSDGSNGFELARHILDHAQNLNKMTLVHSPQQSSAMSMLKKSKAANITLEFQEDHGRGLQKRTGRRVRGCPMIIM